MLRSAMDFWTDSLSSECHVFEAADPFFPPFLVLELLLLSFVSLLSDFSFLLRLRPFFFPPPLTPSSLALPFLSLDFSSLVASFSLFPSTPLLPLELLLSLFFLFRLRDSEAGIAD